MITGPAGYTGHQLWRIGGPLSLAYAVLTVAMVNLLF
jgi:di/tricarboxylate transporter